jgi:hypothetical protein
MRADRLVVGMEPSGPPRSDWISGIARLRLVLVDKTAKQNNERLTATTNSQNGSTKRGNDPR